MTLRLLTGKQPFAGLIFTPISSQICQQFVGKNRVTILSHKLLADLRTYWRKYRPGKWVFAGQKPENHLCEGAAQAAFYLAKKKPA